MGSGGTLAGALVDDFPPFRSDRSAPRRTYRTSHATCRSSSLGRGSQGNLALRLWVISGCPGGMTHNWGARSRWVARDTCHNRELGREDAARLLLELGIADVLAVLSADEQVMLRTVCPRTPLGLVPVQAIDPVLKTAPPPATGCSTTSARSKGEKGAVSVGRDTSISSLATR